MRTFDHRFLIAAALLAAACGGDAKDKPQTAEAAKPQQTPDEYRKAQQRYADSVISGAKTSSQVVEKLGKDYAVGSIRLRDSLALLSSNTKCFEKGRQADPYLAGTVSFFVFMSVVGSNTVQVQESQWSSNAGNIVDACLNLEAKAWKFDATFGKPAAYITQVQFK